jgi:hypothetical protein
MSQSKDHDGHVKAGTPHAEGQHGEKTHERFLEQLHSREAESPDGHPDAEPDPAARKDNAQR